MSLYHHALNKDAYRIQRLKEETSALMAEIYRQKEEAAKACRETQQHSRIEGFIVGCVVGACFVIALDVFMRL